MTSLDNSQRAAISAGVSGGNVRILGVPGSGKSTVALEIVATLIESTGQAAARIITPSRGAATRLRDIAGLRVGVATLGPLVRSISSLAFDVVSRHEAALERPIITRLMSGGEQDSDIEEILAGEIADGNGGYWPDWLGAEVRSLREFRTQLRDLLARVRDAGLIDAESHKPFARLAALGEQRDRAEWVAAAKFLTTYRTMVANSRPAQYDPSELLHRATAIVEDTPDGAARQVLVVDDAQDLTPSQWRFIDTWSRHRGAIVALGDTDLATNSFRGGRSRHLTSESPINWSSSHHLSTIHRQYGSGPALLRSIAEQIGGAEPAVRAAYPTRGESLLADCELSRASTEFDLRSATAVSPANEREIVARYIREVTASGTPLDAIAVIVRSGSLAESLVSHLTASSIPAYSETTGSPLRDHPAVWSLLTMIDVGIGRTALTPAIASELLQGPLGRLTVLDYRRFRRDLRAVELTERPENARLADELMLSAMSSPGALATSLHRIPDGVRYIVEAIDDVRAHSTEPIDELLWRVWNRSPRSTEWATASRGYGPVASAAHESLDAVLALFSVAATALDNNPAETAAVFLRRMLEQAVPNDSLTPRATDGSVLVCTPAAAVGREFDTVIVAGVNDGVWPNTRARSALLRTHELSDLADKSFVPTNDERKEIVYDEVRLFLVAASRATRRLLVTAVSSEDETPSALFRIVAGEKAEDEKTSRTVPAQNARGNVFAPERVDATIGEMVGRLRRILVAVDDPRSPGVAPYSDAEKSRAASALRELARRGVRGADPREWLGFVHHEPVALFTDSTIAIPPSGIEDIDTSALDWFVSSVAGGTAGIEASIGVLVHWVLEMSAKDSTDDLWELAERRFGELDFAASWQRDQWQSRVRTMVAGISAYLADIRGQNREFVVGEHYATTEIRPAGELPAVSIGGQIDRIERVEDGAYVIVDLKTGKTALSVEKAQAHPQLSAYQVMFPHVELETVIEGARRLRGAGLLYPRVPDKVDDSLTLAYTYREQVGFDEDRIAAFVEKLIELSTRMHVGNFTGPSEAPQYGADADIDTTWVRIREVSEHE